MKYMMIPHISVYGANGASSAITVGIPSVPAILGTVLNLERHMEGYSFPETAIVLHDAVCNGRTAYYRGTKVFRPVIARRPLNSSGGTDALEDSVSVNLDISLVIKVEGPDLDREEVRDAFVDKVRDTLMTLRFASGSIMGMNKIRIIDPSSSAKNGILKKLCPGYILESRKEEFAQYMRETGENAVEALVDCCGIHLEKDGARKVFDGWKIPISVGYMAVSPVSDKEKKNQRTPWPHAFAEALVTLGECVFVTKEEDIEKVFWQFSQNENFYECVFGKGNAKEAN